MVSRSFSRPRVVSVTGQHGTRRSQPAPPRTKFDHPKRLAGEPNDQNSTVYTVRIETGVQRGSALTEPGCGVLVCLMNEEGTALLHRIPPLADPLDDAAEMQRICGPGQTPPPGVNCDLAALDTASRRAAAAGPPSRRFQEGGVDEISFLASDLGPLSAVLIGTEGGTWRCEEVDVSSLRSGHTDRFVCRDEIGGTSHPAALLRPVPPGGVVYGSGDDAVVLTREEAARLREWNMQQYSSMKGQLLAATAALTTLGTGAMYVAAGSELAVPFALGGTSSLAYQYLLQRRVDGLAASNAPAEPPSGQVEPGPGLWLSLALSNPVVRGALMAGGLLASLAVMHMLSSSGEAGNLHNGDVAGDSAPYIMNLFSNKIVQNASSGEDVAAAGPTVREVRQVAAGLAGFLVQKLALIGITVMPSDEGVAGAVGAQGRKRVDDKVE